MSELEKLRAVFDAGTRLRATAVVDDDFPSAMHSFDRALDDARGLIGASEEGAFDVLTGGLKALAEKQFDWVERMSWHNKTVLEALALIGSEVGEAVNECRGKEPSEKLGEELADIILRTLDLAEWQEIDIGVAIADKMALNEIRGTRGRLI